MTTAWQHVLRRPIDSCRPFCLSCGLLEVTSRMLCDGVRFSSLTTVQFPRYVDGPLRILSGAVAALIGREHFSRNPACRGRVSRT